MSNKNKNEDAKRRTPREGDQEEETKRRRPRGGEKIGGMRTLKGLRLRRSDFGPAASLAFRAFDSQPESFDTVRPPSIGHITAHALANR